MGSALGISTGIISGGIVSGTVAASLATAEVGKEEIGCAMSSVFGATTGFVVGVSLDNGVTALQEIAKEDEL